MGGRGTAPHAICPPTAEEEGSTPEAELTDLCPNIEGIQETVPEGYHADENGDCIEDEPADVIVLSDANDPNASSTSSTDSAELDPEESDTDNTDFENIGEQRRMIRTIRDSYSMRVLPPQKRSRSTRNSSSRLTKIIREDYKAVGYLPATRGRRRSRRTCSTSLVPTSTGRE